MKYEQIFRELIKYLPSIRKRLFPQKNDPRGDSLNVLAPNELEYSECENFMPLLDGDVVFCPSVYDGDSFRLCWLDHSGRKVRIMGRLIGVDTPEMRGSSEYEKKLAVLAKERLGEVISGKFITIRNPQIEKYGRSMSDIEVGDIGSIKDYMLEASDICKPYDGGTKQKWDK